MSANTHSEPSYTLEFTQLFVTQFGKLGADAQHIVYKKMQELKENPFRHKALTGPFKGCFRVRIGKYRIVYLPLTKVRKVVLIDVDLRKKIYKKDFSKFIDQISQ